MKTLILGDLQNHCPNIDPVQCNFYAQGAVVALENQGHRSDVALTVEGDFPGQFALQWTSAPKKNGWKENRDSTEAGALAIAFWLVTSLTEFAVVEQSPIGTGFDYFLGYRDDDPRHDPDNFMRARLEVSGLGKGTTDEFAQRIREKLKQTTRTDATLLPAYVSVTAFGKPISSLRKK